MGKSQRLRSRASAASSPPNVVCKAPPTSAVKSPKKLGGKSFFIQQYPGRKKRTDLTIHQKAMLIHDRETNGLTVDELAAKYYLARRSVQQICGRKSEIEARLQNPRFTESKHIKLHSKYPQLERAMQEFVYSMHTEGCPVTVEAIQAQAKNVSDALEFNMKFKASKNWAYGFLKRLGTSARSLHSRTDKGSRTEQVNSLKKVLQDYAPSSVYSVIEVELFYSLFPQRAYSLISNGQRTLGSVDGMDVDRRVTLYLCTNATGDHIIPTAVISCGAERDEVAQLADSMYLFRHRGHWCDSTSAIEWLNTVFLPEIRDLGIERAALVFERTGSIASAITFHSSKLCGTLDGLEFIPLGTGCSNPTLALSKRLRETYRSKLISAIATSSLSPTNDAVRRLDPLQASKLIQDALQELDTEGIVRNAWVTSGLLSLSSEEVRGVNDGSPSGPQQQQVASVLGELLSMQIPTQTENKIVQAAKAAEEYLRELSVSNQKDALETWLCLEDSEAIQEAIENDRLAHFTRKSHHASLVAAVSNESSFDSAESSRLEQVKAGRTRVYSVHPSGLSTKSKPLGLSDVFHSLEPFETALKKENASDLLDKLRTLKSEYLQRLESKPPSSPDY